MVANEYYIENEMLMSIFLRLLGNCVEEARDSYAMLKHINNNTMSNDEIRQSVWTSMGGFLKDTSTASKFLFPSSTCSKSEKRGVALCNLLSIEDHEFQSLRSRKLRNRVEHFDEQLDKWWSSKSKNTSARLAYRAIDGLDDDVIYDSKVDLAFMYNPSNGQLFHLGEYFEIHTIYSDLIEIEKRLPIAFSKLKAIVPNLTVRSER